MEYYTTAAVSATCPFPDNVLFLYDFNINIILPVSVFPPDTTLSSILSFLMPCRVTSPL